MAEYGGFQSIGVPLVIIRFRWGFSMKYTIRLLGYFHDELETPIWQDMDLGLPVEWLRFNWRRFIPAGASRAVACRAKAEKHPGKSSTVIKVH